MRLLIAAPTTPLVNIGFVDSLLGVLNYTRKLPGIKDLQFAYKAGVRTDRNRNDILKDAFKKGITHVLWLDTDMIYPHDIVGKYIKHKFDIIGCMYFKRSFPHDPVGYFKSKTKKFSYNAIDPLDLPEDSVIEVDGLGYGGMMVDMKVYEGMGRDKWTHYGSNYHSPESGGNHLTHDLEFCRLAQKHGYKIKMHTGIHPGHITEQVIDIKLYRKLRNEL